MPQYDYIQIIGDCFPDSQAYTNENGNPHNYEDIIWVTSQIDKATLEASECAAGITQGNTLVKDDLVTKLYEISFADHRRNIKNKWISLQSHKGLTSDSTPAVLPWESKLVGINFVNSSDDSSTDIELYKADVNNGSTNEKILTWSLSNVRVARKTDLGDTYIFSAGDKIAIFLKDSGGKGRDNPDDVVINLFFQILSGNEEESSENFSGDF